VPVATLVKCFRPDKPASAQPVLAVAGFAAPAAVNPAPLATRPDCERLVLADFAILVVAIRGGERRRAFMQNPPAASGPACVRSRFSRR